MRVAILAHEKFPGRAKTAVGILRYGDYDVAAVLDRTAAGTRVTDHVSDVQDAPIVASLGDVEAAIDALIVGIAPIGGGFEESWRPDVRAALERGADVIAGLHYFLAEDPEFRELAAEHGCTLRDVRKPPEDLGVADGVASEVDADVVLTVGTDCSTGKMTTTMELVRAAREAGIDAAAVPTGQTGIMIEGWGIPIDRVISDFAAGAVEAMLVEAGDEHDLLVVEGQGSLVHPAYSGVTASIVHGAMPDGLVLCHMAGRETIHGYEAFELPAPARYVELYEGFAGAVREAEVVGGALATHRLGEDAAARDAVAAFGDAIGAPATDPVRFSAAPLVEAIT